MSDRPLSLTGGSLAVADTVQVNSTFTLSGGTLTGGTYDIAGVWKFNSAAITVNAADLTLDGAAARILNQSGANALAALVANAAGASFAITGGYALATPGGFANAGSLTIGNGSTFTAGGAYVQTAGATVLAGGVLSAAGGVDIQAGLIAGTGTVGANLTAAGEVRPGGSAGTLNVVGDYTETPDTVLYLEIGGATAGDGHEQLNATGLATFAGTPVISVIDPFEPALDDEHYQVTVNPSGGLRDLAGNPLEAGRPVVVERVLDTGPPRSPWTSTPAATPARAPPTT